MDTEKCIIETSDDGCGWLTNINLDRIVYSNMDIPIKYMHDEVPRLKKINIGDWVDLYAAEDVVIKRNSKCLVNLGVAMQLPHDFEAQLLPRSSTANKWGCILLNSMGIIDESYCGDDDWWKANLYCLIPNQGDKIITSSETDPAWFCWLSRSKIGMWIIKHFFRKMFEDHQYTLIHAGDKICQFRINKHMPNIIFSEVTTLGNKSRGGFGSTGEK